MLRPVGPRFDAAAALLAAAGCSVAHNPLSNLRIGSGVAPVRQMLEHGINVGIGTDAANTSDTQNMFEATRLASYLSRLCDVDWDRWLGAQEVLRMATEGGARLLGMEGQIGRLSPGYRADFVVLRLDQVQYTPLRQTVLQLVNGESGSSIESVAVDGRFVLDHGRITTLDEDKLRRDAHAAALQLDEANLHAAGLAAELRPYLGAFCSEHGRTPLSVRRRLTRP